MKTIHKFPLPIHDYNRVMLPPSAQLLTVQLQNGAPHLWVLLDTEEPYALDKLNVSILFVGTGQPAPSNIGQMQYLGTIQLHGGQLVLHAFADRS